MAMSQSKPERRRIGGKIDTKEWGNGRIEELEPEKGTQTSEFFFLVKNNWVYRAKTTSKAKRRKKIQDLATPWKSFQNPDQSRPQRRRFFLLVLSLSAQKKQLRAVKKAVKLTVKGWALTEALFFGSACLGIINNSRQLSHGEMWAL